MNDEIPSRPTHLEGLRRLIALLTSAAEIGAVGKKSSEVTVSEVVTDGKYMFCC
jgi:hypothetical protein